MLALARLCTPPTYQLSDKDKPQRPQSQEKTLAQTMLVTCSVWYDHVFHIVLSKGAAVRRPSSSDAGIHIVL